MISYSPGAMRSRRSTWLNAMSRKARVVGYGDAMAYAFLAFGMLCFVAGIVSAVS